MYCTELRHTDCQLLSVEPRPSPFDDDLQRGMSVHIDFQFRYASDERLNVVKDFQVGVFPAWECPADYVLMWLAFPAENLEDLGSITVYCSRSAVPTSKALGAGNTPTFAGNCPATGSRGR